MPNGGPAAGLLQATRRPPVGRPPATAAATRRAERQATRRPPRKRQATRRPPGASHRQGVALIGVHFSQCQRRAGHPQGVALLYTARQFASGVVGWAYIVGPPLAGGLPRVACPGWSAGGWPAAQPRHLLPLNPDTCCRSTPARCCRSARHSASILAYFSFCSERGRGLNWRRMAVPLKPKASRRRFSR